MAWFDSLNTDLKDARNAVLADNWWIVALRGVLAILFGIAAFAVPGATMRRVDQDGQHIVIDAAIEPVLGIIANAAGQRADREFAKEGNAEALVGVERHERRRGVLIERGWIDGLGAVVADKASRWHLLAAHAFLQTATRNPRRLHVTAI